MRRKVLALSPERLSQEAKKEEQQNGHPSRDQSPALSERSDRSGKNKSRHWAKRGRPLQMGGPVWPWTRWQQQQQQQHTHTPSPLAATSTSSTTTTQQAPPAPAGPSNENKPPPIGFTSSASADVARLKRLEKSYAEALRSSLPKNQRRK